MPHSVPSDENSRQQNGLTVILANSWRRKADFPAPLARVATLPVALRAVLGAQKAGTRRILAVTNPETGPEVRRSLVASRRLPPDVNWLEILEEDFSLPSLAQRLADGGENHLTFIFADAVYRPSLHQRLAAWDGSGDAIALVNDNQPVGLFSLSASGIAALSAPPHSRIRSAQELLAWLRSSPSAQQELVPAADWQSVCNRQDIAAAERKLDRWLVKSTDGIFARFNRRISIPISHQLIKTPVTPNMVSIFTLAVGLASGWCFAMGGYLYTLLGAVLSVFASILDGCDGEVARLTFRESAFGCWLETVCDYLYYIFIFGGMAVGLVRHASGQSYLSYLSLTFLLLFGAIASMLVTGYQRRTLAAGRPERYLVTWQGRVEKQRSFILWIGRHTEFIIRRCFLPYGLLAFALFNVTRVAFVMCAVGANMVWPIALYSSHRLASSGRDRSDRRCSF